MILIGRGAFIASLFFFGSAFADQVLVGLAWNTPQQLQKIEARVESVRYVARGIAFVQGDLRVLGDFRVLCLDRAEVEDDYYIADHIHWPLPEDVDLVYDGGGEWALLRVSQGSMSSLYGATHFFWPLPDVPFP